MLESFLLREKTKTCKVRTRLDISEQKLMSAFSNISWDAVCQVDDVNNAYSSFVSNCQAVLKDITTKKISRAKIKLEKSPWFTAKLESAKNKREHLFQEWKNFLFVLNWKKTGKNREIL